MKGAFFLRCKIVFGRKGYKIWVSLPPVILWCRGWATLERKGLQWLSVFLVILRVSVLLTCLREQLTFPGVRFTSVISTTSFYERWGRLTRNLHSSLGCFLILPSIAVAIMLHPPNEPHWFHDIGYCLPDSSASCACEPTDRWRFLQAGESFKSQIFE